MVNSVHICGYIGVVNSQLKIPQNDGPLWSFYVGFADVGVSSVHPSFKDLSVADLAGGQSVTHP